MNLSLEKMTLTKAHRDCLAKAQAICAKLEKADDCKAGGVAAMQLALVLTEYKPSGEGK